MNPIPRHLSQEDKDLVAEYLKNNGVITKGKPGVYTNDPANFHSWNSKKNKKDKDTPVIDSEETE
jgi:hypothetical protein